MNPSNYRSGPSLTSHSNHTIFFSRNEIYLNVGRRRAPVIRSERISQLPYNINNHNFITIKLMPAD